MDRVCVSIGACVCVILTAGGARPAMASNQFGDLTGPWQLFVDDYPVASRTGVVRTYHPFEKHAGNPVLVGDQPWEGDNIYIYGSVLPGVEGGYRIWYHALDATGGDTTTRSLYATSTDGIHWEKPALGNVLYGGSTSNNIFMSRGGAPSVIHTPWDPDPARLYRLISYDESGRFFASFSGDGINWTDSPANPVVPPASDVGSFNWDPHLDQYFGHLKVGGWLNGLRRRSVGYSATTNFESWPDAQLILNPDAYDDRWASGAQRTHFYGLCGFAYESMYLGFLWIFRATDPQGYFDGQIFVELVSSHDGIHWTRQEAPRPPMIPNGAPEAWDHGMVFTPTHPLVEGDTIRLYYGGTVGYHQNHTTWHGKIGLATLRKDGFASLDAGAEPGSVTTRKLVDASGPLRVNYRATGGWLKVEVLDADGNVVPGYSADECAPLQGDGVSQTVAWAEHTELPSGGPIQLRFAMQNASIYSFMAGTGIRILQPPSITLHPALQSVCPGGRAQFSAGGSGEGPLTYQWQKNGLDLAESSDYAGVTTQVLAISNADSSHLGEYRCIIGTAGGTTASDAAPLRMTPASFTGVGFVSGGSSSSIAGMSADGSVVCGTSGSRAFIWSPKQGLKNLGVPADASTSSAAGVGIYQGTVVVAVNTNASTFKAKRWDGNLAGSGAYSNLPKQDSGTREWFARGLGTDGTTDVWIPGNSLDSYKAGRYKQSANESVSFPLPPNGYDPSYFYAASDSGVYAGQYCYGNSGPTNPMRGIGVPLESPLGPAGSSIVASVRAVSRDGRTLGGWSWASDYRWPTIWGYHSGPAAIPLLPGGDEDTFGEILALNGDGTLAGGYSMYYVYGSPQGPREAFVWDAVNGTRQLQAVLTTQYELDLTGWTLREVTAMSADGTVIAGNGFRNDRTEGWVAVLGHVPSPPTILDQPVVDEGCISQAVTFRVVVNVNGPLWYRWQKDGVDLHDGGRVSGTATPALTIASPNLDDAGEYRCTVEGNCGTTVSDPAILRGGMAADLDRDCDVDAYDFALFQPCFTGAGLAYDPAALPDGCTLPLINGTHLAADFDQDDDVDQADFGVLQRCFSGAYQPLQLDCID